MKISKKTTIIISLLVFGCLIGVAGLSALPIINEVNECKDMITSAESDAGKGDLESAIFVYDYFLKKCQTNTRIQPYLKVDYSTIAKRLNEVSRFHEAVVQYDFGHYASALEELNSFLVDYPESSFKESARELLKKADQEKNAAYQSIFYEINSEAIEQLYKGICQGGLIDSDLIAAIQSSLLPSKYWFKGFENFSTDLTAQLPAEFKVAVCFKETNPQLIETCEYNKTGIRAAGAEHILQRKKFQYQVTLIDTVTQKTLIANPVFIQGSSPDQCPEILKFDSALNAVSTFVYSSEPVVTQETVDWIEQQVGQLP
jgi:hypothetical protein